MPGKLRLIVAVMCIFAFAEIDALCLAQDAGAKGRPFYESGVARAKQGDYDGAINDFNQAIEIEAKNPSYYAARGNVCMARGETDAAIADFSKAIEIDPSRRIPYINRGVARIDKGEIDGALADYSKAIALDSKNAAAFTNRGWARIQKGDIDGARSDLLQAIQLSSDEGAYPRFYLYVLGLKQRSGVSSDEFRNTVAHWNDGLKKTVGLFLSGGLSEESLLAQAAMGSPKAVREQKCEGYFYAGVLRLSKGDTAGAKSCFENCVVTQLHTFPEYQMARAELAKIGK